MHRSEFTEDSTADGLPAITDRTVTEQPAAEEPVTGRAGQRPNGPLRLVLWRLHFLSGFLAAPIVLSLAVTGILFAWHPQINTLLHGSTLTAVAEGPARPLAEQVSAAREQRPGWDVVAVLPPAPDHTTTGVTLAPPQAGAGGFAPAAQAVTVYVDPASTEVTGHIVESLRPDEWLRNLHSSWHLGPWGTPFTELAASWVLVSLATGLYLWWPRGRARRRALRSPTRLRGRSRMRQWHTLLGVGVAGLLSVMVVTGLTWTNYAGAWVDLLRSGLSSGTPSVSTALPGSGADRSDSGAHHGGHGNHGESGGAQPGEVAMDRIDEVLASAQAAGLRAPVRITPPSEQGHAWTVAALDSTWPIQRETVAVEPAGGRITDHVGWQDYPLMAKATTMGIAFHEAKLFGAANRVLLTAMALALIGVIVNGYRMWWRRRPAGGLGVPPRAGPLLRTVPVPLLALFAVLMVLLPMLGVSFLIYLLVERLVRARRAHRAPTST